MKIIIDAQSDVISQYIYAKDHNRPHLMASAFTQGARLEMQLKTQNITFPAESVGLDAITETLVSNFGRTYENVYTFCLSDSLISGENTASCNWLVVMTEKEADPKTGCVRVGFGRYDWQFVNKPTLLADELVITIEEMLVLEPDFAQDILNWVSGLAYPWCDTGDMIKAMPELDALKIILSPQ